MKRNFVCLFNRFKMKRKNDLYKICIQKKSTRAYQPEGKYIKARIRIRVRIIIREIEAVIKKMMRIAPFL